MIVRGLTNGPNALHAAAADNGIRVEVSRALNLKQSAYRFTLKLGESKVYHRVSATQTRKDGTPRKVAAVCWHGHAAFFRRLFELEPTAIVTSSRMGDVRYTADTFELVYPATGEWNIGSHFAPCAFRDACDYSSHPCNRK